MAIIIKGEKEIELMRISGRIVAGILETLKNYIHPGVTTKYLEKITDDYIESHGAISSTRNYRGYPSSLCTSINDQVIHGIPDNTKLKDGDIVSVDVSININGYHGDATRTFIVGKTDSETERLVAVTKQSFFEGIKFAKPGCHLHEISSAIQKYVEENGFSVVRDFVGHGIGSQLHESPAVPNFAQPGRGPLLRPGMTLAIEPMVNMGSYEVEILDDDWTVVTVDGKNSAHYENTILITEGEPEILTSTDF